MATIVLAAGAEAGVIGDEFVVTSGAVLGLCLMAYDNSAKVVLLKRDPAGAFAETSVYLTATSPDGVLVAPGAYKAKRVAGNCGLFRD